RLEMLFDFAYQIECYVPAPKRKYGYFVLPILYGDEMVGRLDPKADRKSGTLFIRKLWMEPKKVEIEPLGAALAVSLRELADFNDCREIVIEWSEVPALQEVIEKNLRSH
ncbi:MAG: crosslink repair DNA glycosylase YcaQ family protein, partial [Bacteroidota bacterium]